MKKVIDIEKAMLAMFIINKAFKSKFKRYWGTELVDGVEVFTKRFYYYYRTNKGHTKTDGVKKLLTILGINKSIQKSAGSYQGIAKAWLFINPDKAESTIISDLSKSLLASKVESLYQYNVWYNAIINMNATNIIDNVMPKGTDGRRVFDANTAETWLLDNYGSLVNSSVQSSTEINESDAEFTNDVMAKYVLLDKTSEVFDIEITNVGMNGTGTDSGLVSSVSIELRFKRKTTVVDEESMFIATLQPILQQKASLRDAALVLRDRAIGIIQDAIDNEDNATNDLFYKGQLRVSALELERSEFSKIIKTCIDMDYKKYVKKRKWYQKLLSIVVFIVIVWVSWGWAAPAGAAISATTIAYAATLAATLLALASMAFSAMGYADLVGFYGKFIKVFGIVGTVLGVADIVQQMAEKGFVVVIKERIANMVSGVSKFSAEMMMKSLTYVGQVTNMIMGNKLKKINNANNSIQDKIKEQEEELYDMYDKEFNLPLEALTWQNSPLKVDDAQFEVDYLYEPTKMNICRRSFF